MATRARILADYVSSGVTAAEFDFLDTTSGTPGSGTFLRGDKTWVAAGSTSASDLDSGTLADARFPAGAIINNWKVAYNILNGKTFALSTSFAAITYSSPGGAMTISGITATEGNLLYMTSYPGNVDTIKDTTYQTDVGFLIDGAEYSCSGNYNNSDVGQEVVNGPGIIGMIYTVPASFTSKVISAAAQKEGSPASSTFRMRISGDYTNATIWMLIQEIKQ